ncbi:MAG: DUF1554 domain-containing protein [Chloroflexota bacterium]|nr:DUF1554 domain-containing protein [Chloroflexota bacterium]
MDGLRFDRLARTWGALRSRRAAGALLGGLLAAPLLTSEDSDAKKKKKKKKTCAKKCKTGCCTGKRGKCIQPAQQSLTQCGTGGAICSSTGCAGTCPNCGCSASKPCPAGECCDGKGTCGACLVFRSGTGHDGDFDGLSGADAFCQSLANAANLPGTYMAWLSDTTGSPSTRFTQATVPYKLVDGTTVAANWAALTSGTLAHEINVSETGGSPGHDQVWSHTLTDGTAGGVNALGHCENWTSSSAAPTPGGNTGLGTQTGQSWTRFSNHTCNENFRRLYCFQQR